MARKVAMAFNWSGNVDFKSVIHRAELADQAGVHSLWTTEAWGSDCFTLLTLLAEHTHKAQLGTGIVNTYSRTPAALAQHFATLDALSNGRMIIGLGTSGANVIEHFHGIKFEPALTRLREYVDIINMLMAGTPLNYNGKIFKLGRGFTLRMETVRKHIPIYIASLNTKSLEFTAQSADGWLPIHMPLSRFKPMIDNLRDIAAKAGRDPKAFTVRAPGPVYITNKVDQRKAAVAGTIAFYAARMGRYYAEHFTRLGFGDAVNDIQGGWSSGGPSGGAAAVPEAMRDDMAYVGDVKGAIERLEAQAEAGADVHSVEIDADDDATFERILTQLIG